MPKAKAKRLAEPRGDAAGRDKNSIDDEHHSDDGDGADDLDMERRRLMARNRAKLIALGIAVGVMELRDLAADQKKHSPSHARPRNEPHSRKPPPEPTRRSTRLAGGRGGGGGGGGEAGGSGAEPLLQIGEHGGVEEQGTAAAAAQRGARSRAAEATEAEKSGLSPEEIAARAEQLRQREASRLRELELEGLVDLSREGGAVFVVIGSTGNHYTVRLTDAKRSCNCVDCRVRKRDCKHIRLILAKLQIQDDPSQWFQAVERCFHAAAGAAAATTTGSPTRGGGAGPEGDAAAGTGTGAASGGRQAQAQALAQGLTRKEQEEEHGAPGSATWPGAGVAGEMARDGVAAGGGKAKRSSSGDGDGSSAGGSGKRGGKRTRGGGQGSGAEGPAGAAAQGAVALPARETRATRTRAATAAAGGPVGAERG